MYGANEEKVSETTTTPSVDPTMWSVSAQFESGPFFVAAAYEKHDEYGNTGNSVIGTTRSDDKAWKLGGAFTIAGSHTISAIFERLEWEKNLGAIGLPKTVTDPTTLANIAAGTANEAKLDTWFVGYTGKFGPHTVRASYGENRKLKIDGTTQDDTRARLWAVGYGFSLSKRTEVYALYTRIENDNNSRNDFGTNPFSNISTSAAAAAPAFTVANGSDPQGFGVGIKHTF
jgi:predicted porin